MEWKYGRVIDKVPDPGFLPFEDINLTDFLLESIAVIGYLFVLLMVFYAKRRNKIFASKGFPILVLAIILSFTSAGMDLFTEIYWFNTFEQYNVFKLTISILRITSLVIFALSLLLVFKFTKFLMGEE